MHQNKMELLIICRKFGTNVIQSCRETPLFLSYVVRRKAAELIGQWTTHFHCFKFIFRCHGQSYLIESSWKFCEDYYLLTGLQTTRVHCLLDVRWNGRVRNHIIPSVGNVKAISTQILQRKTTNVQCWHGYYFLEILLVDYGTMK